MVAADHLRGDAHAAVFRQTVGSEVMLVEIRVCRLFKFAVVTMTDAPTVTFAEDVCVAVPQQGLAFRLTSFGQMELGRSSFMIYRFGDSLVGTYQPTLKISV